MSKKEQKLKKNLYKALTEYFIHNPKKQSDIIRKFSGSACRFSYGNNITYCNKARCKISKSSEKCNKTNEKIRDLNLTPQQWDTVEAAITAENISSIEYIRIAYKQGIIDAFAILRETL